MKPSRESQKVQLMQAAERAVQALIALMAIGFLASALVYLYGGRWTVTFQGLLDNLRYVLEALLVKECLDQKQ